VQCSLRGMCGTVKDPCFKAKDIHHPHKHQGLDPLTRSVSRVTAARANASSVFQLFSLLVICSGMISKGYGFVTFFASVKATSICIHLSIGFAGIANRRLVKTGFPKICGYYLSESIITLGVSTSL